MLRDWPRRIESRVEQLERLKPIGKKALSRFTLNNVSEDAFLAMLNEMVRDGHRKSRDQRLNRRRD